MFSGLLMFYLSPLAFLFYSPLSSGGFNNLLIICARGAIRYAHFTPGYRYYAPLGLFLFLDRSNHNDRAKARQNSGPAQAL
jgi:hypothetical protein